jgi:hypothetical protein
MALYVPTKALMLVFQGAVLTRGRLMHTVTLQPLLHTIPNPELAPQAALALSPFPLPPPLPKRCFTAVLE